MRYRGVIFDLDGTLADTLADLTDAVNVGLSSLNYGPRAADEVRQWIGDGMMQLCRRAIIAALPADRQVAGSSVPDTTVAAMAEVFTEHYRRHRLDKTVAYPDMAFLLTELAAHGLKLAVFSNKPHEHTVALVEALFKGWPWAVVEGGREDRPKKPDAELTRQVLARLDLQPAEVLTVGDSSPDMQAARNVGATAVGVTWGFRSREELLAAGADHVIDRPAELLELL